ncbi:UDP-galactopyranose mutase [Neomoorella humiferrea]
MLFDKPRELYSRYENEARKLKGVYFVGRLAEYRYYNMNEAVARARSI